MYWYIRTYNLHCVIDETNKNFNNYVNNCHEKCLMVIIQFL